MIGLVFAALGAVLGYWRAAGLGGNRKDKAQYTVVFAIVGFLLGMALTITLDLSGIL